MCKKRIVRGNGADSRKIEFFFVNSGPEAHYIYPNGDEVSNFEIVYICTQWRGEPTALDGEMEELKFFVPDEIDISEISPPIRSVITALIKKIS